MRPRISIRGCPSVGPSIRWSVHPMVRDALVKIAENGVMQDEGASRAVYPALFMNLQIDWFPTFSGRSILGQSSPLTERETGK